MRFPFVPPRFMASINIQMKALLTLQTYYVPYLSFVTAEVVGGGRKVTIM